MMRYLLRVYNFVGLGCTLPLCLRSFKASLFFFLSVLYGGTDGHGVQRTSSTHDLGWRMDGIESAGRYLNSFWHSSSVRIYWWDLSIPSKHTNYKSSKPSYNISLRVMCLCYIVKIPSHLTCIITALCHHNSLSAANITQHDHHLPINASCSLSHTSIVFTASLDIPNFGARAREAAYSAYTTTGLYSPK